MNSDLGSLSVERERVLGGERMNYGRESDE